MSMLLIKRLARSLWRSKLRLIAVIVMVAMGVAAGISFGSYAQSAETQLEAVYEDTETGVNLPDLWVDNNASVWSGETAAEICNGLQSAWPDSPLVLRTCEPRLVQDGMVLHTNEAGEETLVTGVWHGITDAQVHRVWMPEHPTVRGRLASGPDEVVIDAHAAEGLGLDVGSEVTISAGQGAQTFKVVGLGYHADHLYFAPEGSIMPASEGTFVTGYLSAGGLERLTGLGAGSANLLLLDIEGTPAYDLQSTTVNEGPELERVVETLSGAVAQLTGDPTTVYNRSNVQSVEFLRADAEGAQKSYPYITGMLALVAGITIFLSLQRLIQSQAREIAILRTLGVGRWTLMPAYILAPLIIGSIGALLGLAFGVQVGAPAMRGMYESILGIPVVVDGLGEGLVSQNVAIAMVIVFLAGIRPAWKASRLKPLDVLRGQHEVRLSSKRLQRWTARMPIALGLTIRSSVRKPVRLLLTFLGVGLSMLIFGSMLLMMGSIEDLATGGDRETWDAQAQVAPGSEQAVLDWAKARGATAESLLQFPATPKDDPRQFLLTGHERLSTQAGESLSLVRLDSGELPALGASPPQVLIDKGTSMFLDWTVGSTQEVVIGSTPFPVTITGITRDEFARSVHFHQDDLAATLGFSTTSVLLKFPENASVDSELANVSAAIVLRQDSLDAFASMQETQKQFFSGMMFMGILIAVVVLFNTLLMNLSERDSELATLRVLGAPIRRLGQMLLIEHLVIGLIGGVIGSLMAIAGTQAMIEASVQWAFYFEVHVVPSTLVLLIGIVVVIAVALTPVGTRRIKKMDLVEKVKEFAR
ncbi:MAG: FtsX-like permease family protein [Myxococcota bacterium]|nr:FtsX-like permease family protein [Myxococcota bacterium]